MDYPIFELIINEDLNDDAEVSLVSFVDRPAIQRLFNKFNEEFINPSKGEHKTEFLPRCISYVINEGKETEQAVAICNSIWEENFAEDSYNDYPQEAINNAKRAVEYAEKNGWGTCGEATGKLRANQIANGENITRETIARISGFRRHQQNKYVPYDEGCGGLMWDAWGGDAMINWAEKKLRQIDKQNFVVQSEEKRIISGVIMLSDTPIYRNDATNGEYYVVFTKDTIFKIVQKFFKKGFQSNVNLQHNAKDKVSGVTMFESFISDKDRGILPMKGFEDTPDGSWFGSFKVDDDNVWEMVKSGEIKGFSVEGIFEYTKKETKEEQVLNSIKKILSSISDK
jgi:hypothetical protein